MPPRLIAVIRWLPVAMALVAGFWLVQFTGALDSRAQAARSPGSPSATQAPLPISLPEDDFSIGQVSLTRRTQLHTFRPEKPRFQITQYIVQKGDSAWSIAKQFGIQPTTILWGNVGLDTDAGSLRIGETLNILPVDGVLHIAKQGDTLEDLERLHGVPVQQIVFFPANRLDSLAPESLLPPGETVVVPGGTNVISWQIPGPSLLPGKGRKSSRLYSGDLVNLGTGSFGWPVSPILITQPFWAGHGGIDIAANVGQPVFAADSGTVIFAGWDTTGFGNLIIIDHGNGYWSYYGHNSTLLVAVGQGVVRGQQIAAAGSTGNSTGPHLDFRIRIEGSTFLNPGDFLP